MGASADQPAAVTAPAVFDTDDLPPTQYLILEVLGARWRLGERLWTFPARLRPQLKALAEAWLVDWKGGVVENTVRAWLTESGRTASLDETYVPPILRESQ